jgi:hypothetical protein
MPGTRPGMTAVLRADRLDIVAVGVDQERGVIGRAVVGARSRAAIVAAAGFQALGVEFLDRGVIRRRECDMRAGAFGVLGEVKPQRRLAFGSKARAAVVARTQYVSEGFERRLIEAHAFVDVADFKSDVVVHDDLRQARAGGAIR